MKRFPSIRPLICTVTPRVESLESRTVLSTAYPTPTEQYAVEMINRARANPTAEAQRWNTYNDGRGHTYDGNLNEGLAAGTISPAAKQPVAISPFLTDAARQHSAWIVANSTFTHAGVNGSDPGQRMTAAGYQQASQPDWGENIAINFSSGSLDATTIAWQQQRNLFTDQTEADRGHRTNMMDPARNEIGVGFAGGLYNLAGYGSINALASTQDTARNGRVFLTGVAYTDGVTDDDFYTPGEGLGGISIVATRKSDGAQFPATTWASGGYSLELPAGTYDIAGTGPGLTSAIYYNNVTVAGENVKRDFVTGQASSHTSGTQNQASTRIRSRTLVVSGTSGNDLIGVYVDNDDYVVGVGALRGRFAVDLVDSVAIKAGDGNDRIVIGVGVAKSYVEGGAGKDVIIGGGGEDTLYGNGGIDRIEGNGGNDFIVGENHADVIYGGLGNDRIYGGVGNDTVDAGGGNDRVYGGIGDDFLAGGKGRDILIGEVGADLLHGGAHRDTSDVDPDDTRIAIEVLL